MKNILIKILITLFILSFFSEPTYSYGWTRKKTKQRFIRIDEQVSFETTSKFSSRIDYSDQQNNIFNVQVSVSNNNFDLSSQDYSNQTPFQEVNSTSTTPNYPYFEPTKPMRTSSSTNEDDPDFPGDPGQMPLSDGVWFLLGTAAAYAIYKKKSNV